MLEDIEYTRSGGTSTQKRVEKECFVIRLNDSPILFGIYQIGSFNYFCYNNSLFVPNFPLLKSFTEKPIVDLPIVFSNWLNDVVKPYLEELNTPDLWKMFFETRTSTKMQLASIFDFQPFSEEEKIPIRFSLNEFRILVTRNFNPNQDELKIIKDRLDYLSYALDKHNKFDWKGIAINTAISIGIALSLSPKRGRILLQLFAQIFSNILHLLP